MPERRAGCNLDVRDRFVNYLLTFAVETAKRDRDEMPRSPRYLTILQEVKLKYPRRDLNPHGPKPTIYPAVSGSFSFTPRQYVTLYFSLTYGMRPLAWLHLIPADSRSFC